MAYRDELLGRGEKIVLIARQHWIVIIREILGYSLLTAIFLGLATLLYSTLYSTPRVVGPRATVVPESLFWLVAAVIIILPLLSLLQAFLRWHSKEYVLTNWRVIEIEGLLRKSVRDSSLDKVNDIVMDQSVLGRLLSYGDIEIITGSDIGVNVFEKIADPVSFKTELVDQREALRHSYETPGVTIGGTAPPEFDVRQMMEQLNQLRQQGLLTDAEYQAKKSELLSRI